MILYLLFNIFFSLCTTYNLPILNNLNNKEVVLHLEKFNQKYNLLHIGISFCNNNKILRYDYRAFNEGKSCITSDINRRDITLMFPDLILPAKLTDKSYIEYTEIIENDKNNQYSKDIFWGITNKTFQEIIDYEKTINKKYKLGIYDCRHYVNHFTKWCLNKPTPIWKLNELWDEY